MKICTISLCLSFIINFLQKLEKTFFENNDMAGNSQNYCLKLNPDTVRIMNSEIMECGISLYFTKSMFFGKCIFSFKQNEIDTILFGCDSGFNIEFWNYKWIASWRLYWHTYSRGIHWNGLCVRWMLQWMAILRYLL